MHDEAVRLAQEAIKTFWSANHEIRWLGVESDHKLWLNPTTLLVGRIDGEGLTLDGESFFLDWKTASAKKKRFMDSEKAQWRMSPQALTYGVLLAETTRRFTVRWALKTDPAICDFEWYEYGEGELGFWRKQLIAKADLIRAERIARPNGPWQLDLDNCTRYGENYRCPFRDEGCWKLNFAHVPEGMTPRTSSHLDIENTLYAEGAINKDVVVLDATRAGAWGECNEFYRRTYEPTITDGLVTIGGLNEESEAMTIGTDFHSLMGAHLKEIMAAQEAAI